MMKLRKAKLLAMHILNWYNGEKLTPDFSQTAPVEVHFATSRGDLYVKWDNIRKEVVLRTREKLVVSPINDGAVSVRMEEK